MPVIQTSVFTVLKRFPDCKDSVKQLFKESETFHSMCEDYRRCAEALRHWNESASEEAPARREEYATLLRDLEAEILQSLDEFRYTHKKAPERNKLQLKLREVRSSEVSESELSEI